MISVTVGALGGSLVGLVLLFTLRLWEMRRGARFAPLLRKRLDKFARIFKLYMIGISYLIQTLPARLMILGRVLVLAGAVGAARFARFVEKQAHRIADLVSHRHRFERKETKSQFLKQVSAHKSEVSEKEEGGAESGDLAKG